MAIVPREAGGITRLGIGIGVVLLAVWVVSFVVMKITSMAIHLLVLAAIVFIAMHLIARFRGRS
jgi:hypothetical protein